MTNIVKIILFTPLYVILFWGIELLTISFKKDRVKQNLVFFMLCGFIASSSGIAFFLQHFELYNAIYIPVVFFALSQFPSFYIYIHSLTREDTFSYKIYIHYLYPLFAMLVAIFVHGYWLSHKENMLFVTKFLNGIEINNPKLRVAFIIDRVYKNSFILLGIFYYWLINKRVNEHRKKIDNYFSNTESVNLQWITIFNVLLFLTLTSGIFFHAVERQLFVERPALLTITYGTLTLFYWTIGHIGSRQKTIYYSKSGENSIDESLKEVKTITQHLPDDFKKHLEKVMIEQRPYLETELSLPELTKLTGTNRTYLSKFINDTYSQNFKQFINEFRLKEAEKLLQSQKYAETSILSVSSLCGFSSYHTFNRCFKEKHGISPSVFREQSLKKNS